MLSNAVKWNTVKISEGAAIQRDLPFTEYAYMICVHKAAENNHLTSHVQKCVFESYV